MNGDHGIFEIDYFALTAGAWAPGALVLLGDLDGNGFVDDPDLDILRANWGGTLAAADPSGDGFVGGADFDIVMDQWHMGTPPPAGSSSVPEPGSLALLMLGSLVLLARRRRSRGN